MSAQSLKQQRPLRGGDDSARLQRLMQPFAPLMQLKHGAIGIVTVFRVKETGDEDLVRRSLAGEQAAFRLLLERYEAPLQRLIARVIVDQFEAQDIAQEAFLQAYLGLALLRDQRRFGPWLYGIALNLSRMALRRRHLLSLDHLRERRLELELRTMLAATPPLSPEETQELRETHRLLLQAIGELPFEQREIAAGYFLQGYTYAELASLAGVPLGTIKARLHRARRRLRQRLEPLAPSGRSKGVNKEAVMVPVKIEGVYKRQTEEHTVNIIVLRENDGERVLPIWIGPIEGWSIAIQLAGLSTPRPMTHDLTVRLLEAAGARVQRVEVSQIKDITFYATIYLQVGQQEQPVDARPSDALALAVRLSAPIAVAEEILQRAGQAGLRQLSEAENIQRITAEELAAEIEALKPTRPAGEAP